MKNYTSDQVRSAILHFAEKYDKLEGYEVFVRSGCLYETARNIIFDIFIEKFCFYGADDVSYNNYSIILWYVTEMRKNGFVDFK